MDEEQGLSSPIAGGLRGIRRSVSSSVFSGRAVPPPVSDPQTTSLLNSNSLTLTSISSQLTGINESVGNLNTSLSAIRENLSISDDIEKNKELQKRKREAQLAEEGLREGKESELEKKIQFALLSPVRRVSQVARGILGRLTDSLLFLAGGWLTVQALRFLEFTSSGNIEALKKLKDRFLKDLLLMGGLVLGLTVGFGKVLSIIGRLSARIFQITFGGLFTKGFSFLGVLIRNNVSKFLRFIRSGLGAIGLRGVGLGALTIPGAGLIATLQNRILKSLRQIPIIGELFKSGRKPFDPKGAGKVAKPGWLGKFFTALIIFEKGIKVFTDYNEMRDKGLSKFKSIAIALGKLAVDIGIYLAVVKGTAFALGKIGGLIGFGAGMLTGGPIGAALGATVGAKMGAGLGAILGTIGYFFPGAIKAVTGGLVDIEKMKTTMQGGVENVIAGAGSTRRGVPPGKVAITNKRGRVVGYKDAPKEESVVSADPSTIIGASTVSIGGGEVVPFKTSSNGDNLTMSSNVANIVDATVSGKNTKKATFAGSSSGGGIDDTPDIESSNPNDDSTIVAAAAFNIT
tara:strand:+ start:3121 stop:4833 length:1713 start_codon:yes stop_codon:yes gene_type:complete